MALRNRFDQFAKNILRDALARASLAETEVEVAGAAQKIDVISLPDPARAAERAEMGLLGALSAEPSLFEPFHNTPTLPEVRRCLRKQHSWHGELERRARAARTNEAEEGADPPAVPFPALVILGPGRPVSVLDAYRCEREAPGVYRSAWGLGLCVVVLSELPRTRDTLLLRLLASGRVLSEALGELARMPSEAWERRMAMPLVLHFRLWNEEPATPAEEDVSAEIQAWFEDYEKKKHAETRAGDVLTVLRVRGISVPDAARERILAQKDPDQQGRWLERAVVASSIAEVLDDPS